MHWQQFAAAGFGAIALEVMQWFRLREKLHLKKYQRMLRSVSYWVPTVLAIAVGAIATPLYLSDGLRADQLFIAGAAFPTVFKKLLETFTNKDRAKLGDDDDFFSLGDYLSHS